MTPVAAVVRAAHVALAAYTRSKPASSSPVTRSGWLITHCRLTLPGRGTTWSSPRSTSTTSSRSRVSRWRRSRVSIVTRWPRRSSASAIDRAK